MTKAYLEEMICKRGAAIRGPSVIREVYEDIDGFTYAITDWSGWYTAGSLVKQEDAKEYAMNFLIKRLKEVTGWK